MVEAILPGGADGVLLGRALCMGAVHSPWPLPDGAIACSGPGLRDGGCPRDPSLPGGECCSWCWLIARPESEEIHQFIKI